MTEEAILFPAEIIKVQTMVDGAIRITLDLPADQITVAAKIMEAKQRGAILEVAAVPVKENGRKRRKAETPSDSGATY